MAFVQSNRGLGRGHRKDKHLCLALDRDLDGSCPYCKRCSRQIVSIDHYGIAPES